MLRWSGHVGFEDKENAYIARCFFKAATKQSTDCEDILPQECGEDADHSVFYVFARIFPEIVGEDGAGGDEMINPDALLLTSFSPGSQEQEDEIAFQQDRLSNLWEGTESAGPVAASEARESWLWVQAGKVEGHGGRRGR